MSETQSHERAEPATASLDNLASKVENGQGLTDQELANLSPEQIHQIIQPLLEREATEDSNIQWGSPSSTDLLDQYYEVRAESYINWAQQQSPENDRQGLRDEVFGMLERESKLSGKGELTSTQRMAVHKGICRVLGRKAA